MAPKRTPKAPKTTEEEVIVPDAEGETEEIEETEAPKDSEAAFDILLAPNHEVKDYTGLIYVRQYSQEVHGDDFEALADEFCTKIPRGGKLVYIKVPAEKIGNVEVRFREKLDYDLHQDKQDPNAPIVDKVKVFSDKPEAVRLGSQKIASTVVVSKKKVKK